MYSVYTQNGEWNIAQYYLDILQHSKLGWSELWAPEVHLSHCMPPTVAIGTVLR